MRALTGPRSWARVTVAPSARAATARRSRKGRRNFMTVGRVWSSEYSALRPRRGLLVEIAEEVVQRLLDLHVQVDVHGDVNRLHLVLGLHGEAAPEGQGE